MTDDTPPFGKYFHSLDSATEEQLEERKERYQEQLEQQGYEVTIANGTRGFFAGVLVIDEANGRFGFLEETGSVTWITGQLNDIGSLGSAVAQNPTEELEQSVEGLENADVE